MAAPKLEISGENGIYMHSIFEIQIDRLSPVRKSIRTETLMSSNIWAVANIGEKLLF